MRIKIALIDSGPLQHVTNATVLMAATELKEAQFGLKSIIRTIWNHKYGFRAQLHGVEFNCHSSLLHPFWNRTGRFINLVTGL